MKHKNYFTVWYFMDFHLNVNETFNTKNCALNHVYFFFWEILYLVVWDTINPCRIFKINYKNYSAKINFSPKPSTDVAIVSTKTKMPKKTWYDSIASLHLAFVLGNWYNSKPPTNWKVIKWEIWRLRVIKLSNFKIQLTWERNNTMATMPNQLCKE